MDTVKPLYYLITTTWLDGRTSSWPVPAMRLRSWLAFEKSLRSVINTVHEPTTQAVYDAWWNPPYKDTVTKVKKAPAKKAVAKKAVKKAVVKKAVVKKAAAKKAPVKKTAVKQKTK